MLAQVFLLILAQFGVAPIGILNGFHAIKKRGAADIHLLHDSILQISIFELSHFHIGKCHVSVLKVTSIQGGIEKGRSYQVGSSKVGMANNGLLKGNTSQILTFEGGIIKIDTSCNG